MGLECMDAWEDRECLVMSTTKPHGSCSQHSHPLDPPLPPATRTAASLPQQAPIDVPVQSSLASGSGVLFSRAGAAVTETSHCPAQYGKGHHQHLHHHPHSVAGDVLCASVCRESAKECMRWCRASSGVLCLRGAGEDKNLIRSGPSVNACVASRGCDATSSGTEPRALRSQDDGARHVVPEC